jgi:RHS repeat-associated protein
MLRLHETISPSATTRMAYDGQALIAEYDGSNGLLRRYVHGPGVDEPLAWYEGAGTTDRRWFHADERGSIVAIANGSGTIINVNAYDEYGIPANGNIGRFQYTGQQWLAELGMYYYRARIFSPTLGRFLQSDPIGLAGGMNLYAYVSNEPINRRDPAGLTPTANEFYEKDCVDNCGEVILVTGSRVDVGPDIQRTEIQNDLRNAWREVQRGDRSGSDGDGGHAEQCTETSNPENCAVVTGTPPPVPLPPEPPLPPPPCPSGRCVNLGERLTPEPEGIPPSPSLPPPTVPSECLVTRNQVIFVSGRGLQAWTYDIYCRSSGTNRYQLIGRVPGDTIFGDVITGRDATGR